MRYSKLRAGTTKGFSLVEVVVTSAIIALVFGGLMGSLQFTLKLLSISKNSAGAVALANERLEYIRSLAYVEVGTNGGIPSGFILQNATTSLNGVTYYERVLIEYIDSPDDGLGGADINGILADYKQIKVEYSWSSANGTSSISLLTNVVPPGIESTDGGGTLTVNVFDADVQPVAGAEVHIYNNTTTTTINTSRYTNSNGVAMFSGAPAAANYEITVSKAGYSTDQTYSVTVSNPSPITSHVAVLESAVSTMNFQIDRLSTLTVRTVGPSTDGMFTDTFSNMSGLATSTAITVVSGDAVLQGGVGAYAPSGNLKSVSTTPSTITAWDSAYWSSLISASTTLLVKVYSVTGTSTYTLIPDADLVGNSAGFTSGPINLSGLSIATYSSLGLGAVFTSSNASVTPALHDWQIGYVISEPSIGNIPFTLTSTKIIGSTPVYKYQQSNTTNGAGEVVIPNLEWDSYVFSLNTVAYDINEACSGLPYALDPGVTDTLTLTLVPSVTYSLRVQVVDPNGNPIQGADVDMSRSGFNDSGVTSSCGQTFFSAGLGNYPDYSVDVHATGYVDQTISSVAVDGAESLVVTLIES